MKAKKIALGVGLALLLALIIFIAIDLSHYYRDKSPYRTLFIPRLEVGVFEATEISLDKVNMRAKMLIHSPLPFNIAADSIQYKIYINEVEVIKSIYPKTVNIKKWDSTWIDLPVSIYTDKLLTTLDKADKRGDDSMTVRIKTSFFTHLPFKKNFNIDIDKTTELFYMPTLEMAKVDYDSFSLKGVTLYLNMKIGNRNKMAFQAKDLKFKFAIADNPWVYGAKPGIIDIRAQDTTPLVLPVRISFTGAFKSLGPLIRKGGKTDYKLGLDLKLVGESNAIKDSKVIVKNAGTIKEIVSIAKEASKEKKEEKKALKEEKKRRKKLRD
jgi:LEA14-like dessication related protein